MCLYVVVVHFPFSFLMFKSVGCVVVGGLEEVCIDRREGKRVCRLGGEGRKEGRR